MKRNPWVGVLIFLSLILILALAAVAATVYSLFGQKEEAVSSHHSVVVIDVKGVIVDSRAFIKTLKHFRDDRDVKAFVIRLDSPGGVVGPSQEMYQEVERTRQMGRHVVASLGSLAASGAYYVASGCEKIVTNPGTITGSIGVIMEFADLSRLYNWAKVQRYVIKSGQFKDIGAEYRTMSEPEKKIMQGMVDDVFAQFKAAVAKGRHLKPEDVDRLADGRIYSGQQAVKNGLADQTGDLEDAVNLVAKLSGIKGKPDVVFPQPRHPRILDLIAAQNNDDSDSGQWQHFIKSMNGQLQLLGKPLFIMPGIWP